MPRWNWITDDMFFEKIATIMYEMGTQQVLQIPGVYEIVSEYLNNQALEELSIENDRCPLCGRELSVEGECPNCDNH